MTFMQQADEIVQNWVKRYKQKQQVTKARLVPQDDDLLTVQQAAVRLGVSAKWLYTNHRQLPIVALGGGKRPRIRFKVRDLDQWVSTHTFDVRRKYARTRKH